MSAALEQLRAAGLPMGTWHAPHLVTPADAEPYTVTRYLGWTTDEAKADAARDAGATVTHYRSRDARFSGWEVELFARADA